MTQAFDPAALSVAVDDIDADLMALAQGPGPFASVVLTTEPNVEQASERLQQRWAPIRRQLSAAGALDEILDRMTQLLDQVRLEGPVVALYGSTQGAVAVPGPDDADHDDLAVWDDLPRLAPVVAWHQATPPGLLVVIDRTGADLISGGRSEPVLESVADTDPTDVTKVKVGGWSQPRYQRRAENTWRAMAGEVADRLVGHVDNHHPRLVVVAGDDRAVQELRDQLPDRVLDLLRPASGGPGKGSEGAMDSDTRRWYRTAVAEDVVALLELFKQELGQRDLAVTGANDVIDALNNGAVGTLLVHDDPTDDLGGFAATSGGVPATVDQATLDQLGQSYGPGRLVDIAIQAAWATGATVAVVPRVPELENNLGAILRFRPGQLESDPADR